MDESTMNILINNWSLQGSKETLGNRKQVSFQFYKSYWER